MDLFKYNRSTQFGWFWSFFTWQYSNKHACRQTWLIKMQKPRPIESVEKHCSKVFKMSHDASGIERWPICQSKWLHNWQIIQWKHTKWYSLPNYRNVKVTDLWLCCYISKRLAAHFYRISQTVLNLLCEAFLWNDLIIVLLCYWFIKMWRAYRVLSFVVSLLSYQLMFFVYLNFVNVGEGYHDDDEDEGSSVGQLFGKYAIFA